MNFKKTWKRFFGLKRYHAEGFTLVELIVVIAILAILGGVAVPAYSGYVEKANKQADISLASEVAHALTLHYYANPGSTGGYVILTTDGAEGDGSFGDKAMAATFGENWKEIAVLKYDNWSGGKAATTILNSSYLANGNTVDNLLEAVTALTDVAASAFNDASALVTMLGVDEGIIDDLAGYEVGSPEYKNAATNLLVFYVADELASYNPEDENSTMSSAAMMASMYASVYAYNVANGIDMSELNTNLSNAATSGSSAEKYDALMGILNTALSDEVSSFHNNTNDGEAFLEIMKAASTVSNNIIASSDITSKDLFTSDNVSNVVNNYVNALDKTNSVSGADGSIIVMIGNNGLTDILPNEAYPAS